MISPKSETDLGEKIVIRRGRVDSVDLYEVKDTELELLEKGPPASFKLNFSIFLLSLAFSAIVTLTTTTVKKPILETVFVVVAVIGVFLGGYLLISWWKTRTSIAETITTIRKRIPPEALQAEIEDAKKPVVSSSNQKPAG